MANPTTIRVYYDEDEPRTEDEIRSELSREVSEVEGVKSVDVELAFGSRPPEAEMEVEYDEVDTSPSVISMEIAGFPFIHNAREVKK